MFATLTQISTGGAEVVVAGTAASAAKAIQILLERCHNGIVGFSVECTQHLPESLVSLVQLASTPCHTTASQYGDNIMPFVALIRVSEIGYMPAELIDMLQNVEYTFVTLGWHSSLFEAMQRTLQAHSETLHLSGMDDLFLQRFELGRATTGAGLQKWGGKLLGGNWTPLSPRTGATWEVCAVLILGNIMYVKVILVVIQSDSLQHVYETSSTKD